MATFFKSSKASWIWLVLRLYVGYEFMTAGFEKLTASPSFSAASTIKKASESTTGAHPAVQPWYGWLAKHVFLPNVGLMSFMVKYGEFLTGIALIVGFATIFAAAMAMVMNFNFSFAGSTSTNPQLILLSGIIIFAGGAYAGYLGVDYWFRPYWRKLIKAQDAPGVRAAA